MGREKIVSGRQRGGQRARSREQKVQRTCRVGGRVLPGSHGVEVSDRPGCPGELQGRGCSEYQGGESTSDGLKTASHTRRGAGGGLSWRDL